MAKWQKGTYLNALYRYKWTGYARKQFKERGIPRKGMNKFWRSESTALISKIHEPHRKKGIQTILVYRKPLLPSRRKEVKKI